MIKFFRVNLESLELTLQPHKYKIRTGQESNAMLSSRSMVEGNIIESSIIKNNINFNMNISLGLFNYNHL